MKRLLLSVLAVNLGCCAGDPMKEGGMSDHLSFSVALENAAEVGKEQFRFVMKNVSGKALELRVNNEHFQGTIFVDLGGPVPVEFWEKNFRNVLLTGIPIVPKITLEKAGKIEWVVPMRDFLSLDERALQTDDIAGKALHAELRLVAVRIPGRGLIESNARQVSSKIVIPSTKAKANAEPAK